MSIPNILFAEDDKESQVITCQVLEKALLVQLGEQKLALQYIHGTSGSTDLAWSMLMPMMDTIRCDPRFQAAEERINVVDHRAARLCAGKHAAGAG